MHLPESAATESASVYASVERLPVGPRSSAVSWVFTLLYPLVILVAWHWLSNRYIGVILLTSLWLQRLLGKGRIGDALRQFGVVDWLVACVLSVVSAAMAITGYPLLLRCYPALVNLGLLLGFGVTLVSGPSMVERFARLSGAQIDATVMRYTRRVTQVWCVFFTVNAAFSTYTALVWSQKAWSLYNGAIAYLLAGTLMAVEFVWRQWSRHRRERSARDT